MIPYAYQNGILSPEAILVEAVHVGSESVLAVRLSFSLHHKKNIISGIGLMSHDCSKITRL